MVFYCKAIDLKSLVKVAQSNKPKAEGLAKLIYNSETWLGAADPER
jgi:hypothetical protein